jgi:hypothetical protein
MKTYIAGISQSWTEYQAARGLDSGQKFIRTYQRNDYALHSRTVLPSQMEAARELAGDLTLA